MGKWDWECEPHGQRCETGGTGGTSETSENVRAIVGQRGIYQTFINKILIMNIETHYKELITQLVSACSYKKILENSSFHY